VTRNQKTVSVLALLALLFLGTGFGGDDDDADDDPKIPPKPDEPCPPGQHYELDRRTLTWHCVLDDVGPDEPTPGVIEDPTPDEPTPGVIEDPNEPSDEPSDWIKPYPTGDSFYQVVPGDQFYGKGSQSGSITWRYLATEAFLAASEFGDLDAAGANAFAKRVADNDDNRIAALNVICCAPWNDACYGTWGYDPNKDPAPALNGRVIRLGPQNPDNAARLFAGEGMARCVRIGSPQHKGDGSGVRAPGVSGCTKHELLWLPKLDRKRLWEQANAATGRTKIDPSSETWPNGDPKILPPPFVVERHIHFYPGSNTANVKVWGCAAIYVVEIS